MKQLANRIRRFFRLYRIFISQFLKRLVEYRIDFLTGAFAFFFGQLFNVLFVFLIFRNITNLDGWSLQHILWLPKACWSGFR